MHSLLAVVLFVRETPVVETEAAKRAAEREEEEAAAAQHAVGVGRGGGPEAMAVGA